jgi:hypothetical protein
MLFMSYKISAFRFFPGLSGKNPVPQFSLSLRCAVRYCIKNKIIRPDLNAGIGNNKTMRKSICIALIIALQHNNFELRAQDLPDSLAGGNSNSAARLDHATRFVINDWISLEIVPDQGGCDS